MGRIYVLIATAVVQAVDATLSESRKRMGIEPTVPLLAQSTIGFEDRAAHQSQTRFHPRYHTGFRARQGTEP